jgi:hypothetical protein
VRRFGGLGRAGLVLLDAFAVAFLLVLGTIWERRSVAVGKGRER